MNKLLTMLCLALMSVGAYANGGGSIGGGGISMPAVERKSPEQQAVDGYNRGIKYRDQAWELQEKAAAENNERKVARYERKAIKKFKSAAGQFKRAVHYNPRLYQAHASLGYALRQLGEYNDSLAAYNESLRLRPDYTEAIEYRGETYLGLGRLDDTKAAYMKLMRLDEAQAAKLMDAIRTWLENPPANVPADAVAELRGWAEERLALQTFSAGESTATGGWSTP